MFRTILVPVDRSSFAETAIPHAARLAGRTGAPIHFALVHAVLNAETVRGLPVVVEPTFDAQVEHTERQYLEELAARVRTTHGIETQVALLNGAIARSIENYVRDRRVDLVVMSTHGRGGLRRAWLGSVADRLVRRLNVPILLVRPHEDAGVNPVTAVRRIIAGLDGSATPERALEAAADLVTPAETRLTLVRVAVLPIHTTSPYLPDAARINREEELRRRQEAEAYLEDVARRFGAIWPNLETKVVAAYHTADTLLEAAREVRADLIVVGTHGRGPLTRTLLGSVADKVMRGADVPVFIFPAHAANVMHPARSAYAEEYA